MPVQVAFRLVEPALHVAFPLVQRLIVRLPLLLLSQLVQLGEHGVRLPLRLLHDAPGVGLALAAGVVAGFFHLLAGRPRLPRVLLPLPPQAIRLVLGFFQPLPLFLQLGQHVLEPHGLVVHLRLGVFDHALVQPQPPGDGEGIGLARYADQQPVGGAQRLHVELAAGVLHPRRGHGEGL